MDKAASSFISSTFWTERAGFVAGLKTIEFMEKHKTSEKLIKNGKYLISKWKELSSKYNLNLQVNQMPCICSFNFNKNNNLLKTLITKEMLKKGYLASNMLYVSIYHDKEVIDKYIKNLDYVFKKIKSVLNNKAKILKKVSKIQTKKSFKRLIN